VIGSVIDPASDDQKAVGISRRLFALAGCCISGDGPRWSGPDGDQAPDGLGLVLLQAVIRGG
jgi:hypothetical protein